MNSRVLAGAAAIAIWSASAAAQTAPRGPARADVEPLQAGTAVAAGSELRAALRVRLPDGFHVNSNAPRDPSLIPIRLTIEPPAGVQVAEVVYPAPTDLKQKGADLPLSVFEREFLIGVRFTIDTGTQAAALTVPARLRYQACDETMCYIPTTAATSWSFDVKPAGTNIPQAQRVAWTEAIPFGTGTAPGPVAAVPSGGTTGPAAAPPPAGSGASSRAPTGAQAMTALGDFSVLATTGGYLGTSDFLSFVHDAEAGVTRPGLFDGRGPIAILFLVFVGGLALNLTPCVLPMIPINLAIIGAGAQAGSRGRGFLLGLAYGAAMAVVYGVLGVIVVLTASTFGTINASPWFNLGIGLLFVVLALAMFDVIVIDFSRFSTLFSVSGRDGGSFVVAFAMGAVAALLAGACVAPVVIQVVLFSSNLYAAGTNAALALPFVLGLGMALPWPIAGAGIAALPRPGAWMVRIKQAFGVIILATAAYYGYESYSLFANRWVDPREVSSSVEAKLKAGWHSALTDGLDQARREQKPVLIDLWATWCKNCLTMDRTTLEDPAVTGALAGYIKIKYQAENPDETPVKQVMEHFKAVGLPTYVILRPEPAAAN